MAERDAKKVAGRKIKFPRPNRDRQIAKRRSKATRAIGYPKKWPDEIAKEQAWRCYFCGCNMCRNEGPRQLTMDHLQPLSRGGKTSRKNLAAACQKCNTAKGSMTEAEFRDYLRGEQ